VTNGLSCTQQIGSKLEKDVHPGKILRIDFRNGRLLKVIDNYHLVFPRFSGHTEQLEV
jgi:hypothetical protein